MTSRVNTIVSKSHQSITTDSGGLSLAGQIDVNEFTASIDMSNHQSVSFAITSAETDSLELWACNTVNGTFVFFDNLMSAGMSGGIRQTVTSATPNFLRIKNQNNTFYSFSSIEVFKM
jgi:hypothetical protein